jgi:hypothetical protein
MRHISVSCGQRKPGNVAASPGRRKRENVPILRELGPHLIITSNPATSATIKGQLRVYVRGNPRAPRADRVEYSGIQESDISLLSPKFVNGTTFLNSIPDGVPAPGEDYIIEEDVI